MADEKITQYAENTTPALTDIMEIVDDPGGTPDNQRITLANLKALINDLATAAVWAAKGDLVVGTGNDTAAILSAGTNDYVLTADSGETTGLKWAAAAGGGAVATDTVWDAAGDLVQGTGANTAAKLSLGTAHQILRVNSGATAAEWASAGRVLLQTTTTSGSQKTVTLNPVPSGYNAIVVELIMRSDRATSATDTINCYFNADTTAANYRYIYDGATTAGTEADGGGDNAFCCLTPATNSPANSCGIAKLWLPQYSGTVWNKQILSENSYRIDTTSHEFVGQYGVEWENAAAITRIDLTMNTGNYVDGSIVRFYGVF